MRTRRSESFFMPIRTFGLSRAAVLSALVGVGALCGPRTVLAQQGKLGTYSGTIQLAGTEVAPKVTYRASARVVLPVTERKGSSVSAEFLAGEAPNATVQILQWDSSYTEKSPDSGGQYNTWSCSLAEPVAIPMTTTGVLNVDLKKKTHSMSPSTASTRAPGPTRRRPGSPSPSGPAPRGRRTKRSCRSPTRRG